MIYILYIICIDGFNMDLGAIYSNGSVTVTRSIFRVGGTQFPIRNITSIQITYEDPNREGSSFLIFLGAVLVFIPVWRFFMDKAPLNGTGMAEALFGGSLMILLGILWFKSQRRIYYIEVNTGGNTCRAYSSVDYREIIKINSAINTAIEAY